MNIRTLSLSMEKYQFRTNSASMVLEAALGLSLEAVLVPLAPSCALSCFDLTQVPVSRETPALCRSSRRPYWSIEGGLFSKMARDMFFDHKASMVAWSLLELTSSQGCMFRWYFC